MNDDTVIEILEIDLQVAECGDILARHGVAPTVGLVSELWDWRERSMQNM